MNCVDNKLANGKVAALQFQITRAIDKLREMGKISKLYPKTLVPNFYLENSLNREKHQHQQARYELNQLRAENRSLGKFYQDTRLPYFLVHIIDSLNCELTQLKQNFSEGDNKNDNFYKEENHEI